MRRLLLLPVLVLLVLLVPDLATAAPRGAAASPGTGYGWPLEGVPTVDRGFDPPRTAWGAGHRGVDLRARLGSPVLAAGAGRVAYAGLLAGRGVVVVVHAGGLRTTYEPVEATVHVDDVVAPGDVLGTLAAGHASCRPGTTCLHWGLLRGDTYLDPLSLLSLGRLRLLPLLPSDGVRPDGRALADGAPGTAQGPRDGRPTATDSRSSPGSPASTPYQAQGGGTGRTALVGGAAAVGSAALLLRRSG